MNFHLWLPIALIVVCNTLYAICAKQTPASIHPMATLAVTYLVGAVLCAIAYFLLNPGGNLVRELHHLNWTAYALGVSIVGLEFGSIWMYKAGWQVNSGFLCHSTILVIVLLGVGYLLYHEAITWTKLAGVLCCLAGLYLINR